MKKGVFSGVSAAEYFAIDGINKSGLDLFEKSPAHYKASLSEEREETPAMRIGTALHCAILEPEEFSKLYAFAPEGLDRRTKEGRELFKSLEESGKIILSHSEAELCQKISAAALANSTLSTFLSDGGSRESVILWEQKGVQCKGRADFITRDRSVIVDLKSTEDASPSAFARSCAVYAYHRQAAWYLDGIEQATGSKAELFVFVAFEKKPPFAFAFYYASAAMIAQGREENARLLDRYVECKRSNVWPTYPEELQEIDLPKWKKADDVNNNKELETF